MLKTLVCGVVCFVLGAATSPRAANKNEALELACQRFKNLGGPAAAKRNEATWLLGSVVCGEPMP